MTYHTAGQPLPDSAAAATPKPAGAGRRGRQAGLALLLLAAAGAAQALVLGVTEGVTYRASDVEIAARFEGIAESLGRALKQPVSVKVLSSYNDMRAALRNQSVDLAFIHPTHVALEGVKAGQFRTLAWTAGFTEYKVSLLCRDDKPISDWKTLAGKKLVTPDPDSITAVVTRALLREKGLAGTMQLATTRYQDAVPFYLENRFADYGASAAKAVVKEWKDKGGQICAEARPVPIKHWLISGKLDAGQTALARDTLLGLSHSDSGKKVLQAAGYSDFVAPSAETEAGLIGWLGL